MHNHNKECHTHHNHKHCSNHHDELHHEMCKDRCRELHHGTNENTCCYNHQDCGCGHAHHKKHKGDLIVYTFVFFVFVLSLIFKNTYVSFVLKIICVVLCGYKTAFNAMCAIMKFKFDENTLMTVSASASAIMGNLNEAFLIVFLFGIGEYIEQYAVEKSHRRIENLIISSHDIAFDENGKKTDPKSIKTGDKILVHPGDKLCVDARIIDGNTCFDTSNITGESIPQDKTCGDEVLAGYINVGNAVLCMAVCDYSNSTTAKIKEYVEKATNKKANTEKFISRFSKIYTPAVICLAASIGILLPILRITTVSGGIKRALTIMIASCPCSLVISIPLSYYAAIGSISKHGLLVKGSKYINILAKADAIAFDKTGTITDGRLKVSNIEILGDKTKDDLLNYANALEIYSSHPIARAICDAATITTYKAENVEEHFGKGITGTVNGRYVSLGNDKLISPTDKKGLVLCIDSKAEAVIELSDTIKQEVPQVLNLLAECGVKNTYILSGDSDSQVQHVCKTLGNIKGFGGLLPKDKADKISELKSKHKTVIFVGDGANDAPSLSNADFSVAIGSGSSLALETGDATLISNSLKAISSAIKICIYAVKVIYTNIVFSIGAKAVVIALAGLGTAPVWLALLADVGVLVAAVLNSVSILYKKI